MMPTTVGRNREVKLFVLSVQVWSTAAGRQNQDLFNVAYLYSLLILLKANDSSLLSHGSSEGYGGVWGVCVCAESRFLSPLNNHIMPEITPRSN